MYFGETNNRGLIIIDRFWVNNKELIVDENAKQNDRGADRLT